MRSPRAARSRTTWTSAIATPAGRPSPQSSPPRAASTSWSTARADPWGEAGARSRQISESDWHAIFDANVNGAFWLSQACAPVMKKARYGRIVNIASGAGLRPALNGNQAYCAAKHAIVGMTRQLSFELGPFGVTVNAVAPGIVLSGPWARHQWESYGPEGQQRVIDSLHTRRLGEADDIAHATLFLAAEDSSWISGQILSADGGRS